ncbi:MAG: VOC family protein [Proteobacteria bacterium]|nr:VOC family protein [Pseudomonadota bacterium]
MSGSDNPRKPRVHGIGGVFFKARDPQALGEWYRQHLDFDVAAWGGAKFAWQRVDDGAEATTVWSPFAADSSYFAPSDKPFMLNLRVDDLDSVLAALRAEGCRVLDRGESGEFGKFGYVLDPENNLLELWQPAAATAADETDS